jgi:hypothetical protein
LLQVGDLLFVHPVCLFEICNLLFEERILGDIPVELLSSIFGEAEQGGILTSWMSQPGHQDH